MQETYTTGENGLFVFRRLWPEDSYNVVVEARGHNKGESSELTGKAGETHDLGKIVLINTDAYLAGRVVGSDGQPIVGAEVFNRGDAPGPVATSTDSQGRFRLEGMLPGNPVCLRPQGGIPIHRGQEPGQHRRHDDHAAQGHGAAPGVEAGHDHEAARRSAPSPSRS